MVPSPPPSPSARSFPAARALLLPLKSGNKYRKKRHQVFMLSDGTKWAPETCQAEHYWVWTVMLRCPGECGGLLLWSLSLGARAAPSPTRWRAEQRPPTTCPGSCPGLGCLLSGLCACTSPPPLNWGSWCCQRGHRAGEEGFLISPCYSLKLCIWMGISFCFSFAFHFSSFLSYL